MKRQEKKGPHPKLGKIIEDIRGSVKQTKFAQLMDIKQSRLSRWENGELPEAIFALNRIANYYGMYLCELLEARRVTRIDKTKFKQYKLAEDFVKELETIMYLSKDGEILALIEHLAFDDDKVWEYKDRLVAQR